MKLELDRRFRKKVQGIYEKYTFEVGVLVDEVHKRPGKNIKTYAGGPARTTSAKPSTVTISEVSEYLRKKTGINFYTKPFEGSKKNKDIIAFTKVFFDLCAGRTQKKRAENLLQAIVRNPILRGDYGKNSAATAKAKGFNRFMIDTAQLFKAITAKVKSV